MIEATLETKAETILEFVHGLRGSLRVSFEDGTCAAWLHDLLKPHVTEVLVCDSRKNALLRVGNKNDREDARNLSELLFLNKLHPAYHGKTEICMLRTAALVDVWNPLRKAHRARDVRFPELTRVTTPKGSAGVDDRTVACRRQNLYNCPVTRAAGSGIQRVEDNCCIVLIF